MRSAPTTTPSTTPRAISAPTDQSVTSRYGMPSRASSQAVSRAPCSSGRVSSTQTSPPARAPRRLDDAQRGADAGGGERAGVAVGQHAVAGREQLGPCSPIRRLPRRRSAQRAAPRRGAPRQLRGARAASARDRHDLAAASSAQRRLTAVGRVAAGAAAPPRPLRPPPRRRLGWSSASTSPYAAATPIAGAPRTASRRIAAATPRAAGSAATPRAPAARSGRGAGARRPPSGWARTRRLAARWSPATLPRRR